METLRTATGKEFQSDYIAVIPSPAMAFFRICNANLVTVASVFSNPEEIIQIWCGDVYIAGYTKFVNITQEEGAIKVSLAKE